MPLLKRPIQAFEFTEASVQVMVIRWWGVNGLGGLSTV